MLIISSYLLIFKKKNDQKITKDKINLNIFLILLILISLGLFIWFFNSPLFRYGTFYIVSFIIIAFLVANYKIINETNFFKIEKLKILFAISLIFFFTKNINRQINSENSYLPLTKPSSDNYEVLYDQPKIINPKKEISVCYLPDHICSHEIPAGFQVLKKNKYFLIK